MNCQFEVAPLYGLTPELANTPANSLRQAARATPKGLAPPALCLIRPEIGDISWPKYIKLPIWPEKRLFLWPLALLRGLLKELLSIIVYSFVGRDTHV